MYSEPTPIDYKKKYLELIYAVATKTPNESRHETALRYINEAENREWEPECATEETVMDGE